MSKPSPARIAARHLEATLDVHGKARKIVQTHLGRIDTDLRAMVATIGKQLRKSKLELDLRRSYIDHTLHGSDGVRLGFTLVFTDVGPNPRSTDEIKVILQDDLELWTNPRQLPDGAWHAEYGD